jgi:hypothetical protein
MTDFTDLKARVLEYLGDSAGNRYTDAVLMEAFREALKYFDDFYPQVKVDTITLDSTDREVELDLLVNCRRIISVVSPPDSIDHRKEFSPPYYTYFKQAIPHLKFLGTYNPQVGDQFLVTYVTSHWIDGLDDAEQTSIPYEQRALFVRGAGSIAKQMHANSVNFEYGGRSTEVDRLFGDARASFDQFIQDLSLLQSVTMAGYPKGFDI